MGFLLFVMASWIDRFNFLRVWAPPPPTSERLIALIARVMVPIVVMLHSVMSLLFFRAIDTERRTGWSHASTLACVAIALSACAMGYFLVREHTARGRRVTPARRLRTFREWF